MLAMGTMTGISINEEMSMMMKKGIAFKYWNRSHFLPNSVSYTAYIFFIEDSRSYLLSVHISSKYSASVTVQDFINIFLFLRSHTRWRIENARPALASGDSVRTGETFDFFLIDDVLAYSHGAGLAATYIIQQAQLHSTLPPPFKCAIFLSGGFPVDPLALDRDEVRPLEPAKDGKLLKLPTAHIWGSNDDLYPKTCSLLSKLCDDGMKFVFVHEEGHDIPNARAEKAVLGAVQVIRRTVDRALTAQ